VPVIFTTETIECDVLVIGAGAAGCCAAAAAIEAGARTCIAVKGSFAHIGVPGSGASSCGSTEEGLPRLPDVRGVSYDAEHMYENAVKAGLGLADRLLVQTLVEKAVETREVLERWGCSFNTKGVTSLGYPFVRALEKKIRSSALLLENTMIYDLIKHNGICTGAFGLNALGTHFIIRAGAIVIASGGNAQLFSRNVHPACCTGDGYAMALRCGAELFNLEFMQIFTATVFPTKNLVHAWNPEQLRVLYNRHGQHFLENYLPAGISAKACREENARHAPFSTRDDSSRYLAIAIVKEILAGRGSEHGGVFLDLGKTISQLNPTILNFMRFKGLDPEMVPMEITMAQQCSNGGIKVDTTAMSTIPGLFAAGEAISGTHGADRIGGNMLAQCAVFGRIAGDSAVRFAHSHGKQRHEPVPVPEFPLHNAGNSSSISERTLRVELQNTAWKYGLVIRNADGLHEWLKCIDRISSQKLEFCEITPIHEIITLLELRNLILVGKAVCSSELMRTESRGPHYREDYPDLDTVSPVAAQFVTLSHTGSLEIKKQVIDSKWTDSGNLSFGSLRWG
jgi:L-aspartate oxidase